MLKATGDGSRILVRGAPPGQPRREYTNVASSLCMIGMVGRPMSVSSPKVRFLRQEAAEDQVEMMI